jgi:hypothetical protein
MTKKEERTIRNIIERLKQERLGAAEGYCELKKFDRIYIDTWLIGPLECLLPESRDTDLAQCMSS